MFILEEKTLLFVFVIGAGAYRG